ncbi:MAG: hypothetical protein H0T48_14050 [Gemmatimonadaceae bacterium]|nr:hypothetical protein [Gemmatimonadaceae bacterium]
MALPATQAQAAWERAARMQARLDPGEAPVRGSAPLSPSSSYRADVVRESAREAGIGTQFIDRALAEGAAAGTSLASTAAAATTLPSSEVVVREGVTAPPSPWSGEKSAIEFEAFIPGELPERDFDTVVETVRRSLGDVGTVSGVGRSLSWSSTDKNRKVHVSVHVRDGVTTVRVGERLSQLAGSIFGGVMGGGGGGFGGASIGMTMAFTQEPVLAFGVAGTLVAASYAVARLVYGGITRRRRSELRDLTERLADDLRAIISRRSQPLETSRRRGRLPAD